MFTVDRIKELCRERKIPVSKLENDLGFGNGYISTERKRAFPVDRVYAIAEYFGVSPQYLLYEGGINTLAKPKVSDEDIKFALFGGADDVTDEMFEEVKRFAEFVRQRNQAKE